MQKYIIALIFSLSCFVSLSIHAQSPATLKGASLVNGGLALNSGSSSVLSTVTNMNLSTTYQYFILNRFSVGLTAALGRSTNSATKSNSLVVGPKVGYYFDQGTPWIPYVNGSVRFGSVNFDSDFLQNNTGIVEGVLSTGVAFRKKHLAVLIELGYQTSRVKSDNFPDLTNFNNVYLTVGLAGFIF